MAIRNIREMGDSVLNKECKEVKEMNERTQILIEDMLDTMYDAGGVGLAAPQVGILKRVIVVDIGEDGPGVLRLINPEILETSGEQDGNEGCLSFPGEYGMVKRPNYVKMRAQNRNGEWFEIEGTELFARAMCHENDHLDGVVFKERAYRMLDKSEY